MKWGSGNASGLLPAFGCANAVSGAHARLRAVPVLACMLALLALAAVCALLLGAPDAFAQPSKSSAVADAAESLTADYLAAVETYEATLAHQEENAQDITRVEGEIEQAETQLAHSQERLARVSVDMYKNGSHPGQLIETLLSATSLGESVKLYYDYVHVQQYRIRQCEDARQECGQLKASLTELQAQRDELAAQVEATRQAVVDAKDALRKAVHLDGYKYHQRQGNNKNCGATSFIVGVNTLLGEKRFKDNVKVWESKAFAKNSTIDIAGKGKAWLKDNKLSDLIDIREVPGDIHKTDDLRALLEDGGVVVISSGPDSPWVYVDSDKPKTGLHQYGHFVCFYGYSKGIYYANDSSKSAKRGAGCPYTEEQMQAWLDGRSYHAACVLTLKK